MEWKRTAISTLVVTILGLSSLVTADSYIETFEQYTGGTILTERDSSNVETISVDNWHAAIYFSGTRQIIVNEGPSGVSWDSEIGNYISVSAEDVYYQTPGATLTSAFTEQDQFTITLTEKWYSGLGGMRMIFGNASGNAIEFQNLLADFKIINAAGTTISPSGSESPGQNVWTDIKMDVDVAANSGDGSLTLYWKEHGTSEWTTTADFTDIDLELLSNEAVSSTSSWDRVTIRMGGSEYGAIGGFSITPVPEPATLALITCGSIFMIKRQK